MFIGKKPKAKLTPQEKPKPIQEAKRAEPDTPSFKDGRCVECGCREIKGHRKTCRFDNDHKLKVGHGVDN